MNKILLQCNNLCKYYQEGNIRNNVLKNINFDIKIGEMVAIVGSSGSGKSTLLHILGGLDTPTSGEVVFSNKIISQMSSNEKANWRNRELGFIYQFHHLLLDFTVFENVALPLLIGKKKLPEINFYTEGILESVGLIHKRNYRPSELSGGERQRVAVARALVNKPRLVLADEPTGNLDIHNTERILRLLRELSNLHNTSFLVVTHDLKLAKNMNRQLEMCDGHLLSI